MIADELRALAVHLWHLWPNAILHAEILDLADRVEAVERALEKANMENVSLRGLLGWDDDPTHDAFGDAAIKEQADTPGWFDPNSHGRGGI